jgi:formiminotetrahydrofolate cyclodeaminase
MNFSSLQTEEIIANFKKSFQDIHQTTDKTVEKIHSDLYEKLASGTTKNL